jgi:hypothetical protein
VFSLSASKCLRGRIAPADLQSQITDLDMTRVLKRLKWLAMAVALASAAIYVGDYFLAAHKMRGPQAGNALGSVTIVPTYVIPHKDGRAEIIVGDATVQPCIHSLFPHFGYTPCWYLNRKQPKPIVMSQALVPRGGPDRVLPSLCYRFEMTKRARETRAQSLSSN